MSGSPAISCVIPVFNGKRDLQRAVDSVLVQRPDVQVVLVDDHSTDGTADLVLDIARGEARVVAISLAENRGQSYARNVGVAAADASYITFLDQDDQHITGWYDHAVEELNTNQDCAAIKGAIELMDLPPELGVGAGDPRLPSMANSVMWNVVMRKLAYFILGGCPTTSIFRTRAGVEDVAFMMALTRHFRMAHTDYPSTQHYVHPNGASALFLRRTRVVGSGFEFVESIPIEQDQTLETALAEFQARAALNVNALRGMLK
jgi:glycosyltransferase involved in cell wall biosynthesis